MTTGTLDLASVMTLADLTERTELEAFARCRCRDT
jgi:hypothetical protein